MIDGWALRWIFTLVSSGEFLADPRSEKPVLSFALQPVPRRNGQPGANRKSIEVHLSRYPSDHTGPRPVSVDWVDRNIRAHADQRLARETDRLGGLGGNQRK